MRMTAQTIKNVWNRRNVRSFRMKRKVWRYLVHRVTNIETY